MRYINLLFLFVFVFTICSCDTSNAPLGEATIDIFSITPDLGKIGTEVTIEGNNFTNESRVFFNDTEVTDYKLKEVDKIVVIVPDNATSGRIGIINGEEFGFSDKEFVVISEKSDLQ